MDLVLGRKERCESVISTFPAQQTTPKPQKKLSETDKINIALDEIILSIPDIATPKKTSTTSPTAKDVPSVKKKKSTKTKQSPKKQTKQDVFYEDEFLSFNVPVQDVPVQDVPVQDVPVQDVPVQDVPVPQIEQMGFGVPKLGVKYKMTKEEETKFLNTIQKELKDLPMRERLAARIKLVDEENKKRSLPQIETYSKIFDSMTREAISTYEKTLEQFNLKKIPGFVSRIKNLLDNLDDVQSTIKKFKKNFNGEKWEILINKLHLISLYSKDFVDFFQAFFNEFKQKREAILSLADNQNVSEEEIKNLLYMFDTEESPKDTKEGTAAGLGMLRSDDPNLFNEDREDFLDVQLIPLKTKGMNTQKKVE
jgi:hypothetical protein